MNLGELSRAYAEVILATLKGGCGFFPGAYYVLKDHQIDELATGLL